MLASEFQKYKFLRYMIFINISILLIMMTAGKISAETVPKVEPVSLAVVDFRGVLAKSSAAVSVRKQLDMERRKYKKEFAEIEKKLRVAQQKLAKQRAIVTAEAFEKRARELKDKAREAQKRAQVTNQLLKKSFDQSMNEIRKHLVKIIAEVAEETGAGVVLFRSAIVIAVKKLEVSQEVLKRLNEKLPTVKVVFVKSQ
jgi:Skp family chaperone for outer membrane proteins